jgi:hypothetical protein
MIASEIEHSPFEAATEREALEKQRQASRARQEFLMRQLREWLRREELTDEAQLLRQRQREVNRRTHRIIALCRQAGRVS